MKFDPEHFAYDLHPSKHSDVIGGGSPDGAPATDIEGHIRKPPFEIGVFTYQKSRRNVFTPAVAVFCHLKWIVAAGEAQECRARERGTKYGCHKQQKSRQS